MKLAAVKQNGTLRDVALLILLDLALFYELIFNGYIVMHDFNTIPYFANTAGMVQRALTGTGLVMPVFGVQYAPGFSLLDALFLVLFGRYAINLLAFFVLAMFTFGSYYLMRQFSDGLRALLGTAFALVFLGLLNNIIDDPLGLYVWFLPFTMGLYYRYRTTGKAAYLLLSGVPAALSSAYGPAIPSLMLGLLSIELALLAERRRIKELLVGLLSIAYMAIVYALTHISAVLYSRILLGGLSQTFYAFLTPSYNTLQALTANVVYPWEEYIEAYMPWRYYYVYTFLLVLLACILIWELAAKRRYFPLMFFILFVGLMSYSSNYLGLYSFFNIIHLGIINHIDPFEYDPVIGLWFGIALASFDWRPKIKGAMTAIVVAVILVISAVFFVQSLVCLWAGVNVPAPYVQAYKSVEGAQGVTILIPSSYSIELPFYAKTLTVFGQRIPYLTTPDIFFYTVPPSWMGENQPESSGPYAQLYSALYGGNGPAFREYAKYLDIEYIVYFAPSTVIYQYSSETPPLSQVLNITGFVPVENYSGEVVLLKNPEFNPAYNFSLKWGSVVFNLKSTNGTFVSPLPAQPGLVSSARMSSFNGLVEFTTSSSRVAVSSVAVLYNEIAEVITGSYIMASFAYFILKNHRGVALQKPGSVQQAGSSFF